MTITPVISFTSREGAMISRTLAIGAACVTLTFPRLILAAAPGKSLALALCAQCHVVAADQGFLPPERPQGPDFSAIADKAGTTAKSLRRFLLTTHKNPGAGRPGMPKPLLTNAQIDDLVGFILSQAPASPAPGNTRARP